MNNKILIGSIIAVAILISVSFTSVVGYSSIESDVKISPLFNIRSSRAIDRDGKGFKTDYVGKGEESVLSIPKRDDKVVLFQKIISRISQMDDEELDEFSKIINSLIQNEIVNRDDRNIDYKYPKDFTSETNLFCIVLNTISAILFLPIFIFLLSYIGITFLITVQFYCGIPSPTFLPTSCPGGHFCD
jgi:hypothetical protein